MGHTGNRNAARDGASHMQYPHGLLSGFAHNTPSGGHAPVIDGYYSSMAQK